MLRAHQGPIGSDLGFRRAPCDLRTGLHLTGHQMFVRRHFACKSPGNCFAHVVMLCCCGNSSGYHTRVGFRVNLSKPVGGSHGRGPEGTGCVVGWQEPGWPCPSCPSVRLVQEQPGARASVTELWPGSGPQTLESGGPSPADRVYQWVGTKQTLWGTDSILAAPI